MGFAQARAAFLGGGGGFAAVLGAFRDTTLWVPVDADGRVFTLMWGGLPWLTVFTTVERLRAFAEGSERNVSEVRMFTTSGATVIDQLMDRAPTPTALMVDAGSTEPFAFAPVLEVSPHCYVDVDEQRVVVAR